MNIKIFKIRNRRKEKEQLLDALSKEANMIYEARKQEVLEELNNDVQKIIFLDWWYGGVLNTLNKETKEYERALRYRHVSKDDWDKVHGYIMETISLGMG